MGADTRGQTVERSRFRWLPHRILPTWDGHCHLAACPGEDPSERFQWLWKHARRLGIERVIVFMGWPFHYDPSPRELVRQNDQVLKAIEHHHQHAWAYCYVSPRYPEASQREIDRCVRDGPMVGIKLWVARRCTDPGALEVIAHAVNLGAVIFQHTWLKTTGNLPGESTPEDLVRTALRFPKGRFIAGHAGGNWRRALGYFRHARNVVVEVAGSDPVAGFVEKAVATVGDDRVIFGSDAAGRSFASQLGKVYGARIAEPTKRAILRENLRRWLLPTLKAKGMA